MAEHGGSCARSTSVTSCDPEGGCAFFLHVFHWGNGLRVIGSIDGPIVGLHVYQTGSVPAVFAKLGP